MKFLPTLPLHARKQGGFTLIEFMLVVGLSGAAVAGMMFLVGGIESDNRNSAVRDHAVVIKKGVMKWQGGMFNVTGVDMTALCADDANYVPKYICGTSSAADTNPFGGGYEIKVNSTNPARSDLTITNIQAESVGAVANMLAGISADQCRNITNCDTVKIQGTSVIVTL